MRVNLSSCILTENKYDVIRGIVKGINDIYNARNEIINNVWR